MLEILIPNSTKGHLHRIVLKECAVLSFHASSYICSINNIWWTLESMGKQKDSNPAIKTNNN